MKRLTFSWTQLWCVICQAHSSSAFCVGSSPRSSRYATSRNVACSASCSIGYPRYHRMPLSPSMYVIALRVEAVFMKAGS